MYLASHLGRYDHPATLDIRLMHKRDMICGQVTVHFPGARDMPDQVAVADNNDVYDFLAVQRSRYAPQDPPADISRACAQINLLMRRNARRESFLCALARAGLPPEPAAQERDFLRLIATEDLAMVLDDRSCAMLDPSHIFLLRRSTLSAHERLRASRDPYLISQAERLRRVQASLSTA